MAVSAAVAITGKKKVLVFAGGYHGGVFYFRGKGSVINAPFEYLLGTYNDSEAVHALVAPDQTRGCEGQLSGQHDVLPRRRDAERAPETRTGGGPMRCPAGRRGPWPG